MYLILGDWDNAAVDLTVQGPPTPAGCWSRQRCLELPWTVKQLQGLQSPGVCCVLQLHGALHSNCSVGLAVHFYIGERCRQCSGELPPGRDNKKQQTLVNTPGITWYFASTFTVRERRDLKQWWYSGNSDLAICSNLKLQQIRSLSLACRHLAHFCESSEIFQLLHWTIELHCYISGTFHTRYAKHAFIILRDSEDQGRVGLWCTDQFLMRFSMCQRPTQNKFRWTTEAWLCHNLFEIRREYKYFVVTL